MLRVMPLLLLPRQVQRIEMGVLQQVVAGVLAGCLRDICSSNAGDDLSESDNQCAFRTREHELTPVSTVHVAQWLMHPVALQKLSEWK